MLIGNCEISDETVKQVVKRMHMGTFEKDSLLPIIKAFQPDVWLMSHQIIDRIVSDEIAAGRIVEVASGFFDVPKKSIFKRIQNIFAR